MKKNKYSNILVAITTFILIYAIHENATSQNPLIWENKPSNNRNHRNDCPCPCAKGYETNAQYRRQQTHNTGYGNPPSPKTQPQPQPRPHYGTATQPQPHYRTATQPQPGPEPSPSYNTNQHGGRYYTQRVSKPTEQPTGYKTINTNSHGQSYNNNHQNSGYSQQGYSGNADGSCDLVASACFTKINVSSSGYSGTSSYDYTVKITLKETAIKNGKRIEIWSSKGSYIAYIDFKDEASAITGIAQGYSGISLKLNDKKLILTLKGAEESFVKSLKISSVCYNKRKTYFLNKCL